MNRKWTTLFFIAGALCLLVALGLAARNIVEERRGEASVAQSVSYLAAQIPEKPPYQQQTVPQPQVMMTQLEYDGHGYIGVLKVPSLELELSIQGDWSYPLLKSSPCLYTGNLYDGLTIAGHNYSAHFGRLKDLTPGDALTFTDVDGNVWEYTVSNLERIAGYDVETMVSGDWDMTLFTCTPGGQNRVAVRCTMDK